MTTKHISVDLEAYDLLESAKKNQKDTFSQVIKRAFWASGQGTAGKLLETTRSLAENGLTLSDDAFELLEKAQEEDSIAPDHWKTSKTS